MAIDVVRCDKCEHLLFEADIHYCISCVKDLNEQISELTEQIALLKRARLADADR